MQTQSQVKQIKKSGCLLLSNQLTRVCNILKCSQYSSWAQLSPSSSMIGEKGRKSHIGVTIRRGAQNSVTVLLALQTLILEMHLYNNLILNHFMSRIWQLSA